MGWIRAKRMGPVAYYLYRDAKSYQAGKPALHTKFGPYSSMKEAEAKREEEESGARVSLPHRCGTDNHSKVAHYPLPRSAENCTGIGSEETLCVSA